jgi:hypothetical protein
MPDRRKSYVGIIEHDELSFKPQQFTSFLAGHLGWEIRQPLKIDFPAGRELAIIRLTRAYGGQGSVALTMTASDSGTYTPRAGKPVQRVALGVIFDDPSDWHDPASENLVAGAMRDLDEAIRKLTTYERIWQRTTGYWRCGTALYQAPDAPTCEPAVAPPPSPPPIQSSGASAAKTITRLYKGKRVEWRAPDGRGAVCRGVIIGRYGVRWTVRQIDSSGTATDETILYDDELYDEGSLSR